MAANALSSSNAPRVFITPVVYQIGEFTGVIFSFCAANVRRFLKINATAIGPTSSETGVKMEHLNYKVWVFTSLDVTSSGLPFPSL
jgi:hypothetical protein